LGCCGRDLKPEYLRCREVPPLAPVIERFDSEPAEAEITFTEIPLPRIWFETEDENGLIQIQRDRFLHNWKQGATKETYPHYQNVFEKFSSHLHTFESFLQEQQIGTVEPRQYELTYVNHIPQGTVWKSLEDINKLFPDFSWRSTDDRFLPIFEAMSLTTTFPMPEQIGRLHVTIRLARRTSDGLPVIRLDFTARGLGSDTSKQGMRQWFDEAHKWIVWGFTDLTGKEAHDEWKRQR
jgi:uncharacterized protein (TIGR04255 family)